MEPVVWPLRFKYTWGRNKDFRSQKGHARAHGGNNYRKVRRHKLSEPEKRAGLHGYHVFKPRVFVLNGGKLRARVTR